MSLEIAKIEDCSNNKKEALLHFISSVGYILLFIWLNLLQCNSNFALQTNFSIINAYFQKNINIQNTGSEILVGD